MGEIDWTKPIRLVRCNGVASACIFIGRHGKDYVVHSVHGYQRFDADGGGYETLRVENTPVTHTRWLCAYSRAASPGDVFVKVFHEERVARQWAGLGLLGLKEVTVNEGDGM